MGTHFWPCFVSENMLVEILGLRDTFHASRHLRPQSSAVGRIFCVGLPLVNDLPWSFKWTSCYVVYYFSAGLVFFSLRKWNSESPSFFDSGWQLQQIRGHFCVPLFSGGIGDRINPPFLNRFEILQGNRPHDARGFLKVGVDIQRSQNPAVNDSTPGAVFGNIVAFTAYNIIKKRQKQNDQTDIFRKKFFLFG